MGMGGTAQATAIASLIATVITVAAGYFTNRAATRASVRNTAVTSRTDIEKEAFERAKGFYTDTIDRQDREIHELEGKVDVLEGKVSDQAQKLREQDVELADLRRDLDVANRALRLRFPDEP